MRTHRDLYACPIQRTRQQSATAQHYSSIGFSEVPFDGGKWAGDLFNLQACHLLLSLESIGMHLNVLDIFVLFVVGFWVQRFILHRRRNAAGLPLPPGPPGFPLLGNLFDFPKTDAWLTGARWGKTYGESHLGRK